MRAALPMPSVMVREKRIDRGLPGRDRLMGRMKRWKWNSCTERYAYIFWLLRG